MSGYILYMGDDDLTGAAGYLATVMTDSQIPFVHVPSDRSLSTVSGASPANARAVVLSDYPFERFASSDIEQLKCAIQSRVGFLMIGGWESFGSGGYLGTVFEELLPVVMQPGDDRVNWSYPCVAVRLAGHDVVNDLPFERPPVIGGYNRVESKPGASVVLGAQRFATCNEGSVRMDAVPAHDPLLVLSDSEASRRAAFMTDVAPHWVGGLVDWGDQRVHHQIAGNRVEVGSLYCRFLANLLRWVGAPGVVS